MIRVPEVRLIDQNGEQVGIVSRDDALRRAEVAGMDLVEVAATAKPPVCKIMDYSKFKYQQAIRERQARKNQTRIDVKEIKFRPGTDTHDFDVKLRAMKRFLEDGDKVKCTLRFRGREMAHQELGLQLLQKVEAAIEGLAKVEQEAKLLGRQMTMVVAPLPAKIKKPTDAKTPYVEEALNEPDDDDD
ncbi:MAG: translation initiation factor IF-3 [Magnetococcales bacterium]|nr:translation initiation factor IF-3 [Magnetococcales bacterium]